MSNLTYEQQKQLRHNSEYSREAVRVTGEKMGDADKFKLSVDRFRINNGMKPMYGGNR
jgi:hypothetical protein